MQTIDATSRMTADVLIVGFGPVGKLLVIQLGRRGHAVVVVDRNEAGYPLWAAVSTARGYRAPGSLSDPCQHSWWWWSIRRRAAAAAL